jgi:predicted DNA-binding antitoxin AbrB/MazE fold protein
VEKENVFRVGRAPPEVHGLGESEVLGQPDELRLRKIGVELCATIARAIVHHDDLERLASLRLLEGFQAAPQEGRPVAGNGVRGPGAIVVVRLVEARYENGVLLPVDRLGLRPGESVNLIVVRRPVAGRWDLPKLAKAGSAEDLALAEQGLAEWASALDTMERS